MSPIVCNIDGRRYYTSTTKFYQTSCKDKSWWINQGYNEQKANSLTNYAQKWCNWAIKNNVKHDCVGMSRRAMNDALYGGREHYKKFGWACNVGKDFLSKDRNFKKIPVPPDLKPEDIPKGVIVLYDFGYCYDKNGKALPHGEISDGKGYGLSDGKFKLLKGGKIKPLEIWIPV